MRSFAAAALLVPIALAAPGCCGRIDRADSAQSFEFTERVVSGRTRADADATARTLTNLPSKIRDEWNDATGRMWGTCRLYTTGATR